MRPRLTAGRLPTSCAQRSTFYSSRRRGTPPRYDIALHYVAIPRPDSHIGDGVLFAGHIATAGELFVQYVELAFGFHRKAVDRVLDLHWRIVIEVAEAAAEERRRALQPE